MTLTKNAIPSGHFFRYALETVYVTVVPLWFLTAPKTQDFYVYQSYLKDPQNIVCEKWKLKYAGKVLWISKELFLDAGL